MSRLLLVFALLPVPSAGYAQEGRTRTRLLFSFEKPGEAAQLLERGENSTLNIVSDVGMTHGKQCARWVAKRGGYGTLELGPRAISDWRDFDYLAIDVTAEGQGPKQVYLELWDGRTKGYPTRCTFEDVRLKPGRQTLLYPINRARRNGKEGRSWEELEPQDKIDLGKLTRVKLFVTTPKDRDAILWIDNIRLLQEDAAKPKLKLPLPDGAIAFKFGSPGEKLPGFRTAGPADRAFATRNLTHAGTGWPDAVAGTFLLAPEDRTIDFRAAVPAGKYRAWLCAGPVYRAAPTSRRYFLHLNDKGLVDDNPTAREYLGEKYFHRFVDTFYSEKPDALWTNYIDRMYPVRTIDLDCGSGEVRLRAVNHFLSALILVPTSVEQPTWDRFVEETQKLRRAAFAKTLAPLPGMKPVKAAGGGDVVAFVPDAMTRTGPRYSPSSAERKYTIASASVAPGQLAIFRAGVTAFADLQSTVSLGPWNGAGTLSTNDAVVYAQDFRFDGEQLGEAGLKPMQGAMLSSPRLLPLEGGLTRPLWVVQPVPRDAKPGAYAATLTLRAGKNKPVEIPLRLTVYPFTLDDVLPLSLGMYYAPRPPAGLPAADQQQVIERQLRFMRRIGFTAVPVGSGVPVSVGAGGKVRMRFDDTMSNLAKKVGMGKHPKQYQMGTALGVGRGIGRRLLAGQGAKVDQNPGIELRQAGFREAFLDAMRQQKAFYDRAKLPVAVEIVDEPRETPNPWNRNLADTIRYAELLHKAGLTTFVTPMSDTGGGKDYTVLVNHADILSIHAWKASAKFLHGTHEQKKTLWLYNTGMDRFSWGFYAWRVGAEGRWEWHFSWPEDQARGGYPGREWHNPFTGSHGLASDAPPTYPGAMLFSSAFLDVAEGIADYTYLYNLQKQIARRSGSPAHAKTVKEARAFLAALKKAIPEFPEISGLASAEDGALVGLGVRDEARLHTPAWRERIAGYLAELAK